MALTAEEMKELLRPMTAEEKASPEGKLAEAIAGSIKKELKRDPKKRLKKLINVQEIDKKAR